MHATSHVRALFWTHGHVPTAGSTAGNNARYMMVCMLRTLRARVDRHACDVLSLCGLEKGDKKIGSQIDFRSGFFGGHRLVLYTVCSPEPSSASVASAM